MRGGLAPPTPGLAGADKEFPRSQILVKNFHFWPLLGLFRTRPRAQRLRSSRGNFWNFFLEKTPKFPNFFGDKGETPFGAIYPKIWDFLGHLGFRILGFETSEFRILGFWNSILWNLRIWNLGFWNWEFWNSEFLKLGHLGKFRF